MRVCTDTTDTAVEPCHDVNTHWVQYYKHSSAAIAMTRLRITRVAHERPWRHLYPPSTHRWQHLPDVTTVKPRDKAHRASSIAAAAAAAAAAADRCTGSRSQISGDMRAESPSSAGLSRLGAALKPSGCLRGRTSTGRSAAADR